VIRTALLAGGALCGLAYLGVVGMLYAQQTALEFPADRTAIQLPDGGFAGLQVVSVRTSDGLALHAWYRAPDPGRPTILFLHGNGGNLNGLHAQISRLAIPGCGLMALEYRGYGGNPGVPSGAGLARDADAAMAFLAEHGVASSRVVVYGHSLGTGVATELAARMKVAALVLDSPFTSIAAVAQKRYWYLPAGLLLRSKFPVRALLPHVEAPVLILQGARDRTVPPAMGRADFMAARDPKVIWCAPEAGHMQVLEQGGDAVLRSFIARYVEGG
jgi:uncharacterized protein